MGSDVSRVRGCLQQQREKRRGKRKEPLPPSPPCTRALFVGSPPTLRGSVMSWEEEKPRTAPGAPLRQQKPSPALTSVGCTFLPGNAGGRRIKPRGALQCGRCSSVKVASLMVLTCQHLTRPLKQGQDKIEISGMSHCRAPC